MRQIKSRKVNTDSVYPDQEKFYYLLYGTSVNNNSNNEDETPDNAQSPVLDCTIKETTFENLFIKYSTYILINPNNFKESKNLNTVTDILSVLEKAMEKFALFSYRVEYDKKFIPNDLKLKYRVTLYRGRDIKNYNNNFSTKKGVHGTEIIRRHIFSTPSLNGTDVVEACVLSLGKTTDSNPKLYVVELNFPLKLTESIEGVLQEFEKSVKEESLENTVCYYKNEGLGINVVERSDDSKIKISTRKNLLFNYSSDTYSMYDLPIVRKWTLGVTIGSILDAMSKMDTTSQNPQKNMRFVFNDLSYKKLAVNVSELLSKKISLLKNSEKSAQVIINGNVVLNNDRSFIEKKKKVFLDKLIKDNLNNINREIQDTLTLPETYFTLVKKLHSDAAKNTAKILKMVKDLPVEEEIKQAQLQELKTKIQIAKNVRKAILQSEKILEESNLLRKPGEVLALRLFSTQPDYLSDKDVFI